MVAQDLTKLTVVLVLLGGILAIAVFRPQILPSATNEPDDELAQVEGSDLGQGAGGEGSDPPQDLPVLQEGLDQRQVELDEREAELGQDQAELEERKVELNRRQDALDGREAELEEKAASLQAWKERLIEQANLLNEKENDIAERLAAIQAEQARLAQEQENLQTERAHLDEEQARLRKWEVDLAKQEQKAQGFRRWSVAALVVACLLAVPSVLVLVALMRQGQRTSDKEVQQAQVPQTRRRERVTQHGGLATVVPAPIHGDNGRNKERVEHYL